MARGGGRKTGLQGKPARRSALDELAHSDSDPDNDAEAAEGDDFIPLERGGAGTAGEDELDEEAVYALDDDEDEDDDDDEDEEEYDDEEDGGEQRVGAAARRRAGGNEVSQEEDDDDDDDDDEDAIEEALMAGGKAAKLARQARFLETKLKLQRGEDDSDGGSQDDDDHDDAEAAAVRGGLQDKLWGRSKGGYYQSGEKEADSDAEAAAEEEAEVRRLQAAAIADVADDDFFAGAAPPTATGTAVGKRGRRQQQQQQAAGGVSVEAVTKELEQLTQEQRQAAVLSDAPELLGLLDDLQGALNDARSAAGPLLREVGCGGLSTAAGLSYLEAKHLLLLQHCMCIVAYLMLKAEGRSVADHPVIARMVQLRAYLERVRPIDRQLSYQIDKLLRATAAAATTAPGGAAAGGAAAADGGGGGGGGAPPHTNGAGGGSGEDVLRYRPNPSALLVKSPLLGDTAGLDGSGAPTGVYRPPKLNPVAMEEDRAASRKEQRRVREMARRAERSTALRELAEELAGAPEEVRAELPGMDTAAAVAARQRLEARSAAEEDLMLRVPLSKAEAKKLRAQRRAGLAGGGLDDFADDVADLVAASGGTRGSGAAGGTPLELAYGKTRLSQLFGADLAAQQAAELRSGDADVAPLRPLAQRRAERDALLARRALATGSDGDDSDGGGRGGGKRRAAPAGERDEFFEEAAISRAAAKEAKRAKHAAPELLPPLPEPSAVGARKISYEIQKNRGLTPHRRKDLKNPRKKHRIKYGEAVKRRKGQVATMREAPSAPRGYGGEATGIKARLSKSVRLG